MNKIIIILLIIPLLLQAQTADEWLTHFADARFEEGKIVYSYCRSDNLVITGIVPRNYSESLMELIMDFQMPAPHIEDVSNQQQEIREYLVEEQLSALIPKEQKEYLQLAAMVLIWDMELDRKIMSNLQEMERSATEQLKEKAELVLRLEEVYRGLR